MCTLAVSGGILGHRDGAILVRCSRHTSVWVSHLKKLNTKEQSYIKLPATMALPTSVSESLHSIEAPEELCVLSFGEYPSSFHEIFVWKVRDTCLSSYSNFLIGF